MAAIATASLGDNHTTCCHITAHSKGNNNYKTNENKNTKQKYKSCKFLSSSICNMKFNIKKSKQNSKTSCNGNVESSSNSRKICGNLSCIPSLLFSSCLKCPNSIVTNITTAICCCIQNLRICWWWCWYKCWFAQQEKLQQQKQKQYKIQSTYLNNPFTASLTTALVSVSASKLKPTITKQQKKLKPMDFYTSLKWYYFSWLLLSILAPCTSLSMTEVRIPKHIMRYETASLGCKYDLDGESLYSVKWYKDGFEFYRYVPRDNPPGQVFPLPGVDIDLQNSTDNVVVLNRVTLQSTGRYRCEVSGEAPSFQTVSGHEDMIVVVTPTKGPQITGGQPRYSIGEKVSVNCTSAPSKPICHLSWLINGVHANRSYLRYYEPKIVGREGLEVATLGLEFRVRG